jgi:hypothetical protein
VEVGHGLKIMERYMYRYKCFSVCSKTWSFGVFGVWGEIASCFPSASAFAYDNLASSCYALVPRFPIQGC